MMGIRRQRGVWEWGGEEWLAERRGWSDVDGARGGQGWASAHQLTMACPALLAPEATAGRAQGAEPCGRNQRTALGLGHEASPREANN